ncbi:uncharacterized protein At5g50100, chloroplastic isoform X2 [Magnolia sinica]|uniref:uncharacterized protein At5g50100, chloroplastic isoform X2 n=1 Tax=Magnolia sinica TaxID=86752 RepID=UPI00265922E5|nr:uncharacterized protein At5g50100, chloroplastic isoform X2 [Magnolia sinica]
MALAAAGAGIRSNAFRSSLPRFLTFHSPSLRISSLPRRLPACKYHIRGMREEATLDPKLSSKDDNLLSQNWKIKMLYDGECPLCMREVMGRIHAILSDGTVVKDVDIATIANVIYGVWAKYRLPITGHTFAFFLKQGSRNQSISHSWPAAIGRYLRGKKEKHGKRTASRLKNVKTVKLVRCKATYHTLPISNIVL